MIVAIRIIVALIAGLAVLRILYALGSDNHKARIRAVIDRFMTMLTLIVVIYWIYMIFLYWVRKHQ